MNWYKKAEFKFDFYEIEKRVWNKLIKLEQEKENISFDLENNDEVGDLRKIDLDYKHKTPGGEDDQYRILAQMYNAGGDWENSIRYFKCQLEEKWTESDNWRKGRETFIYIPTNKEGNLNLIKGEKGLIASENESDNKSDEISDRQLWKSLKKHCEKRVKEFKKEYFKEYDPNLTSIEKKFNMYLPERIYKIL